MTGVWEAADLLGPMVVRVAATLRLADHVAGGARSGDELARLAGADPGALDVLLRHLVELGLLECDPSGRYSLTSSGDVLRDDHPAGARGRLDLEGALGRAETAVVHLLTSIRTGRPCYEQAFGAPFWDDLAADAGRRASYDAHMSADVSGWAPSILAAYDWAALRTVVDVGGGDGTLLASLLEAHPLLRGTVFDLPEAADGARSTLASRGLTERGAVVEGSFFESVPGGADAYVLCAVLHNWEDDPALAILRRCAEAAGPSGAVVVVEKTGVGGESVSTAMALRTLAWLGGRERGVGGILDLARLAGFGSTAVHPAGELSVVELRS